MSNDNICPIKIRYRFVPTVSEIHVLTSLWCPMTDTVPFKNSVSQGIKRQQQHFDGDGRRGSKAARRAHICRNPPRNDDLR